MIKKYGKTLLHFCFILLLVALLLGTFLYHRKAAPVTCQPLTLEGQFSVGDETWQPLQIGTLPTPREGTLTVQGHFDRTMGKEWQLHLLLDHLEYSLSVNGELISASDGWDWKSSHDTCNKSWVTIPMPTITKEDTVELQLRSNHRISTASAYRTALSSFYSGDTTGLHTLLQVQAAPLWIIGLLVCLLAVIILGTSLACSLLGVPTSYRLWTLGFVALCLGSYTCLDSADLALYADLQPLLTCGRLICLLLGALEVHIFLARELTGWRQKAAKISLYIHIAFVLSLLALSFVRHILPYDLVLPWGMFQLLLTVVLLLCCGYEATASPRRHRAGLAFVLVVLLCTLAELTGSLFPGFPHGWLLKLLPVVLGPVLFIILLRQGIRFATDNGQKANRADALAVELENSRILLAMNQIRTHFIFNILNAISGMCKYDPAKADRTVVLFARFLRTNIDIMQTDTPVTFSTALRHMEDYITLEQVRFGERLNFVTDIEEDYFCLPPLVLQPLVENAIKHGLSNKPEGGTITLRTWVEGNDVCVSIHDDGVGFDMTQPLREGSVGLQNVRFRLQHIMHGTLALDSAPGEGTTATIRIPLEEATACM